MRKGLKLDKPSAANEIVKPVLIGFLTVILMGFLVYGGGGRYLSMQNSLNLFDAIGDFEHVNRIAVHYNSAIFEIDSSDYDFEIIKTLLNPSGTGSFSLVRMDMDELILYMEIDYFVDGERLLSASVFKIPDGFVPPGAYRFVINNLSKFDFGEGRGLLFLGNYNRNLLSRVTTRRIPLSRFDGDAPGIEEALELLI